MIRWCFRFRQSSAVFRFITSGGLSTDHKSKYSRKLPRNLKHLKQKPILSTIASADMNCTPLASSPRDCIVLNESEYDKTNIITCAPSKDSGQPGHTPSLIRVFAVRFMVARTQSFVILTAKTDLIDSSLCRVHMSFCWFRRHRLIILITDVKSGTEREKGHTCI